MAITPVPPKSVGSTLGLTKRASYDRTLFLKDARGRKVDFRLTRSGTGAADDKRPEIAFARLEDHQAFQNKVFSLQDGGGYWLNILKPTLP